MQMMEKTEKGSDESVQHSNIWNDWIDKEDMRDPSYQVTLALGSPELDIGLQVWPPQC